MQFTTPARTRIDPDALGAKVRERLEAFESAGEHGMSILTTGARQEALTELERVEERIGAPPQRMEHALHLWVAFAIVPLFALANAGVWIEGDPGTALGNWARLG